MKKLSFIAATSLVLLVGVSCKTQKDGFIVQPKPNLIHNVADNINSVNKILAGEWTVLGVNGESVKGEDRPYITFEPQKSNPFLSKFYGYNGCNAMNGEVALTPEGSMKRASDYVTSLKYCPEAAYEIGFSMVMNNISSYKIEKIGDEYLLYLTAENTKQTMTLRKSNIGFINGAWSVTRIGDVVYDDETGMEVVIDVPEKKIHGNTGCNILNGQIMIDPDVQHSIRFSNIATTRMACDNPEREQSLLSALNQVVTAERQGDNGAVLRDASGKLVLELTRLNLDRPTEE